LIVGRAEVRVASPYHFLYGPNGLRPKKPWVLFGKLLFSHKNHSCPIEWMKVPPRDLSHARYFKRDLIHAVCCFKIMSVSLAGGLHHIKHIFWTVVIW